jgi:hypothetical protein
MLRAKFVGILQQSQNEFSSKFQDFHKRTNEIRMCHSSFSIADVNGKTELENNDTLTFSPGELILSLTKKICCHQHFRKDQRPSTKKSVRS